MKKMMKSIHFSLELYRKHYSAIIPPPATTEELRECHKALKESFLPYLPQQYFAFLKNACNGCDLGATFYGTKPMPVYYSKNYTEDIVSANKIKLQTICHNFKVGYNASGSLHLFYNLRVGKFETRRWGDNELVREYDNFADMLGYEAYIALT